MAVFDFWYWF